MREWRQKGKEDREEWKGQWEKEGINGGEKEKGSRKERGEGRA